MSLITQLINNNFGGIRRKDAYFSQEKITCSDCQNVELFYTGLNSGVGIRTSQGNTAVTKYIVNDETISLIPADEQIIEIFETVQDAINYLIAYTESSSQRFLCRAESSDSEQARSNAEIVNGSFTSVKQSERLEGVEQKTREGKLYHIDLAARMANLLVNGLSVTGKACGTNFV